jgi:glycosyltransferase involved in cell wall biosynthesis
MSTRILHLVGWFFPHSVGGSEVYVEALARHLAVHGFASEVAVPGGSAAAGRYDYRGLTVHRHPSGPAAEGAFREWLRGVGADLVHFHSVIEGQGAAEAEVVRALGLPLVLTAHVAGVVCARGTMLRWGACACDGRMLARRCAACYLHRQGMSRPAASAVAAVGGWLDGRLGWLPGRLGTAVRMPGLLEARAAQMRRLLGQCDRVIAVCQWLFDALRRNGVPAEKLALCRQAADPAGRDAARPPRATAGPLRVGYLGRFNPMKGVDVLVRAVRSLPASVPISLTLHGTSNSGEEEAYFRDLRRLSGDDSRINVAGPVARAELADFFAGIDLLAVPSVCLETGPLVVFEAFAHRVPVLGSDLGGIAELVRPGGNGWLIEPGKSSAWADWLRRLVADRARLKSLDGVAAGTRTWEQAAAECAAIYRDVLQQTAGGLAQPARVVRL